MSINQMDSVVEVYLQRLKKALEVLPAAKADQLYEDIVAHVSEARRELRPENESALRELLDHVGDPEEIAASASIPPDPSENRGRRSRRALILPAAVGLVLCGLGIALGLLLSNGSRPSNASSRTSRTSLPPRLRPTAPILLEHGTAGGTPWMFWAKAELPSAYARPVEVGNSELLFSPQGGVCTALALAQTGDIGIGGGSGPCIGARGDRGLVLGSIGPGTGWDARIAMGVTSTPAKAFRIELVGGVAPVIVTADTTKELSGFSFFAVSLPVSQRTVSIEALGANGTVLAVANPESLPQPP